MRILYVDIDTLRPDHLGCYGYHRPTSPNIDAVAAQGVRFEKCYASDTPCLPSRAALFTGRFGTHTGIVNHGHVQADTPPIPHLREFSSLGGPFVSWTTVLRRMGFRTVSFSPFAERHAAWWFYDGFLEMHNTGRGGTERADEVVPPAMDWLDRHGRDDNWFLHLNLWDPHTQYRTPEDYGNPFEDSPPPSWMTDALITRHQAMYGPHSARTPHGEKDPGEEYHRAFPRMCRAVTNTSDYRRWIDGYDVGIHYADHWLGKVFEKLGGLGVWEDTLVIISTDHGETQGELNVYGDHHLADHITHRIPLIIRGPGVRQGHVDHGFHYNLDLPPTIVGLLGGADCPESWDGAPFTPALTEGTSCGREYLVLSHAAWSISRGVRFDRYLLMEALHDGFKQAVRPTMLFDVDSDPHELNDLSEQRPEIVQQGRALLQQWLQENLAGSHLDHDPHIAVLHYDGPFHTTTSRLTEYADTVREIWGEEASNDLMARHRREYERYLQFCRQAPS